MSPWCRRLVLGCLTGIALSTAGSTEAAFTITDLGVVAQGQASGATGINAAGAIAGTTSGTTMTAVEAAAGGQFQAINTSGLPGVTSSSTSGIGNAGDVSGTYYDSLDKTFHAFRASGGMAVDFGSFLDPKFKNASSFGVGVNASGELLGTARLANGSQVVFRSSTSGLASVIALPGGSQAGQAAGINNSGTVVGSYLNNLGVSRVFIAQEGGGATDLLSQFNARGFGLNAYASGINDRGDVTGYGDFNGQSHAFFASANGTFTDIGVTSGFSSSISLGLNDQGQVVGKMNSSGANSRAFFWDQSAGLFDLNSLLSPTDQGRWTLTSATGINDSDQIVGQGYLNGQLHGFALTLIPGTTLFAPTATVPEPPSAWMALAGLMLVGGWAGVRRGRIAGPATA